jgi:hypothetical protein
VILVCARRCVARGDGSRVATPASARRTRAPRRSRSPIAPPRPRACASGLRSTTITRGISRDDETIAYLKERIADLAEELPGYGVYLEPQEQPDRVLWLPPGGEATVIWYEDDEFARREGFVEYVAELFEVEASS